MNLVILVIAYSKIWMKQNPNISYKLQRKFIYSCCTRVHVYVYGLREIKCCNNAYGYSMITWYIVIVQTAYTILVISEWRNAPSLIMSPSSVNAKILNRYYLT